ncbi:adenine methyltransferase [Helicobacter didelphidarum]|uniref:Adenine methyltransferase n=1 Tax=Helicobacter didelphidarum TaxID=2040648 RepID=A0A3D8I3N0_9HELI|nr:adenine methyltransferase [Helicobacter didelphidarum]
MKTNVTQTEKQKKESFSISRGKYKGLKLLLESNATTRPTKALVKKSFFDTLQNVLQDTIFIECFAGSGQMGFEALSMGAKKVMFFEKDSRAFSNLLHNARLLEMKIQKNAKQMPYNNMQAHIMNHIQKNKTLKTYNTQQHHKIYPMRLGNDVPNILGNNSMQYYLTESLQLYCKDFFYSLPVLESCIRVCDKYKTKSHKIIDNKKKNKDSQTKTAIIPELFCYKEENSKQYKSPFTQQNRIILYIDPPFSCRDGFHDIYQKTSHFIQSFSESLSQSVDIITIEMMSNTQIDERIGIFHLQKLKKFGKTSLAYFTKD